MPSTLAPPSLNPLDHTDPLEFYRGRNLTFIAYASQKTFGLAQTLGSDALAEIEITRFTDPDQMHRAFLTDATIGFMYIVDADNTEIGYITRN